MNDAIEKFEEPEDHHRMEMRAHIEQMFASGQLQKRDPPQGEPPSGQELVGEIVPLEEHSQR